MSEQISVDNLPTLQKTALTFPAIDNHAHPILRKENRNDLPYEGVISEANGEALARDAPHTLACLRATPQLAQLLGLPQSASWEEVKAARVAHDYEELCKASFKDIGIETILIDDELGDPSLLNDISWHDQFTRSRSRRIVRVEILAEKILRRLLEPHLMTDTLNVVPILNGFTTKIREALTVHAQNPDVAGFKSIVCYRTGLDVSMYSSQAGLKFSLLDVFKMLQAENKVRLAHKDLNDLVVRTTLEIAGEYQKPVQFHTGLGDSDINLNYSSPARLQQVIRSYPQTPFVLLHSSYPFTREAGYLAAIYSNVYLDYGEVFPVVSAKGQKAILSQLLELTPTNKLLFSTDGHYWPETYYLATLQSRRALYEVLKGMVESGDVTETQAMTITENMLFHTSNKLYRLGLTC
ncbi:Protein fluG [Leucoagaricus sp. SymC.cos]|nr:Protein fluG [Leucoagaricus sp. SymC.cos]